MLRKASLRSSVELCEATAYAGANIVAVDMNLKALGVTEEEVKKVGGEIILVIPRASLHLCVAVSSSGQLMCVGRSSAT